MPESTLAELAFEFADEEPRCTDLIAGRKSVRFGQPCGRELPCTVHRPASRGEISAAVVAEWLEEEVARRDARDIDGNLVGAGGGAYELADELTASGHWTKNSAARLIWSIRNGDRRNISMTLADQMTSALDQANVWYERPGFIEAAQREGERVAPEGQSEPAAVDESQDAIPCSSCAWPIPGDRPDARVGDTCSVCFANAHKGTRFGALRRDDLLELYARYVKDGYTLTELAGAIWQLKGYRNRGSCASAISQAWLRNGWPMRNRSVSKRLRGQRRSYLNKNRKLPEGVARSLHRLHWDDYVSLNELGRRYGAQLDMKPNVLANQLSYTFKMLRLPVHDRIEMTVRASTKHGNCRRNAKSSDKKRFLAQQRGEQYDAPCETVTVRGKPCRHRALLGSKFCHSHDPDKKAAIALRLARMRERSPIHDPDRVEPAGPLVEILTAYRHAGGTWRQLGRATGLPDPWLSHVAHGRQTNVSRDRAQLVRDAIALPVPDDQHPIVVGDTHVDDLEHVSGASVDQVSGPPVRLARLERAEFVAVGVGEPESEHDEGRYPSEAAA